MPFIETEEDLREREAWLRANHRAVARYLRQGRECTVFTFSRREPADRFTTRVGGLPCWPRIRPWPVCRACSLVRPQPMLFVAQLDFRGSPLRPAVPGDVLTFHYCDSCRPTGAERAAPAEADAFRRRHGLPLPALGESLVYTPGGGLLTWHAAAPGTPLPAAGELPEVPGAAEIGPFYGTAHATLDYPTPRKAYGGGIAGEEEAHLLFTLHGTKVGGYPPPIQPLEPPVDSRGRRMRFIGTIGSITAAAVDPEAGESGDSPGDWMWGDMGCLYLWMSEMVAAEVTWAWDCY